MIGAFVGLFMVTVFNVNIFVALIVAMAVGAVLGYLLEFVALRPLRKKKGVSLSTTYQHHWCFHLP